MLQSNTNPYSLTVTTAIRIDPIKIDIAKQAIVDGNRDKVFVVTDEHRGIGEFEHPILFQTPSVDGWRVAIDARQFKSASPTVQEQLEVLRTRAALALHCAEKESADQLFDSGLMIAYSAIISGMMARQYNLDPLSKMNIDIVAALFFFFITRPDNYVFNDEDMLGVSRQIIKNMRYPSQAVESVIGLMVPGRNLQALVDSIKAVEGTDRTLMLTPAVMINAASGLWYGVNADMILGILFEHPPTFAAVVMAATGNGFYSRAEMGKRLKSNTLLRAKVPHTHSVINQLIEPYTAELNTIW